MITMLSPRIQSCIATVSHSDNPCVTWKAGFLQLTKHWIPTLLSNKTASHITDDSTTLLRLANSIACHISLRWERDQLSWTKSTWQGCNSGNPSGAFFSANVRHGLDPSKTGAGLRRTPLWLCSDLSGHPNPPILRIKLLICYLESSLDGCMQGSSSQSDSAIGVTMSSGRVMHLLRQLCLSAGSRDPQAWSLSRLTAGASEAHAAKQSWR